MKKYLFMVLAALLLLASCEEAGKVNYDALELIEWKGNLPEAPEFPNPGWMYYNTVEDVTYLFDGNVWKIVSKDTERLSITIDGEELHGSFVFPFDGEAIVTKTVTITNTGTTNVYFDEEGPVITTEEGNYYSEAYVVVPSWKTCLKPKESQSFTVRFVRDEGTLFDKAYIKISDASGRNNNVISLVSEEIYEANNMPISVTGYLYYSEYSYSWISYYNFPNNTIINFKTSALNQKGTIAKLELGNRTEEVIDIPEGSFFWIDGKDAEDFSADMSVLPHMQIYPNSYVSLNITFTPKSLGEKEAVLHISQGNASDRTINIKMRGRCVENPFDEDGCLLLNSSSYDANSSSSSVLLASREGTEGFFVFRGEYIREYDKRGVLVGDYKVPAYSYSYVSFCYKDGTFYFYSSYNNGSEFRYSTYDPNTNTFTSGISCTKDEFEEATGMVVSYPRSQILSYKDIELLFEEKNPYQISILKDDVLLGTVIGKNGFQWRYNCCISGDYIYWASDCFVKRFNIKEAIESLT